MYEIIECIETFCVSQESKQYNIGISIMSLIDTEGKYKPL